MKIYELFSKRQKRLQGKVPDVYQYEDIPQRLRVQVVHIWEDAFGDIERESFGDFCGAAYEAYQYIHDALNFLSDPIYKGANEEFLKAHEHYRKRRYKECLNDCLKAFESCLKTICKKRNWQYDEKRSAAKDLIQIAFDNELIPSFMQSHFSGLKTTLESGLPTVRNRQSGHGQGPTQVIVPEYVAAYALHLTASNILLLAKADEKMK